VKPAGKKAGSEQKQTKPAERDAHAATLSLLEKAVL
jgi:hypothetical protein